MRKNLGRPPLRFLAALLVLMQLVSPLLCGAEGSSHPAPVAAGEGVAHGHAGHEGQGEHGTGHGHFACAEVLVGALLDEMRPAPPAGPARAVPPRHPASPVHEVPSPIPIFA